MRVGVFGGSFNPVHRGHLQLAQAYRKALSLEQVLMIPAGVPPHKEAPGLLPGEARLALCRLACRELPGFSVYDGEVHRPGQSYTVDTLRQLEGEFPGAELFLIVGSDMFLTLEQWRDSGEIFRRCHICTGAREEQEMEALRGKQRQLAELGAKTTVLDLPVFPISSTQIRRAVALGADEKQLSRWVPEPVAEEILRQGYYREEPEMTPEYRWGLSLITPLLTPARLFHSRCVADSAWELAHRYGGVEPERARLAGLLHDVCKDLPREQQRQWMEKSPVSDPLLYASPPLWHGFAGANYLKFQCGVEDEELLDAVRYHTTARKSMSTLEAIVYLADYISLDRSYPDVERMRQACRGSAEEGMAYALRYTVGMLAESGKTINRDTWEAYNQIVPR